jgi:hypothetical protein
VALEQPKASLPELVDLAQEYILKLSGKQGVCA